ncbi:MAG: PASTA domain-containing protein [Bacteroidetes bacterium]|nr:PASTA domain-containing protein [Bacteroidota bacterium]
MNFFKFFITRYFWSNLGLAVAILFVIGFASSLFLKSCTNHGEKIEIPDLTGISIEKAAQILNEKNLRYQIIDTVFNEDMPKLSITDQIPEPKSFVKRDRVIYLTLNAPEAPKVMLPNIVGKSLRIATSILESVGLKVGTITRKPDLATDVVLEMGIAPGTKVTKGTEIPLVVAESGDEDVEVPDLMGLTLSEAKQQLETLNLNETHIFDADAADTSEATIYKMRPSRGRKVSSGSSIDLYLK